MWKDKYVRKLDWNVRMSDYNKYKMVTIFNAEILRMSSSQNMKKRVIGCKKKHDKTLC